MTGGTHVLYRFYSVTGQLLYVGITMNPVQRFKSHKGTKDWWADVSGISIEHYDSREDLANAERRAIRVEHPLHNIVHAKGKQQPYLPPAPEPVLPPPAVRAYPPPIPFQAHQLLFGQYRDTRYGCQSEEQYLERVAEERAKQQARRDCTLCDANGYRNLRLCDHIDHKVSRWAEALKRVQRERLQVVSGGDA